MSKHKEGAVAFTGPYSKHRGATSTSVVHVVMAHGKKVLSVAVDEKDLQRAAEIISKPRSETGCRDIYQISLPGVDHDTDQ